MLLHTVRSEVFSLVGILSNGVSCPPMIHLTRGDLRELARMFTIAADNAD